MQNDKIRITTSEKFSNIMTALARIQAAVEPVHKTKGVKVMGERATWESTYAPLSVLDAAVREQRHKEGIAQIQSMPHVQGAGHVLVTRLALGEEWVEVEVPIKQTRDGSQGFGGGFTFARRWTLCALFDLVPDDAEEKQGYQDARREGKAPRKGAAPGGLGEVIEAIRGAGGGNALLEAASRARSAFPVGEAAQSIERAITARMVAAIEACKSPDRITELRDLQAKIQARGTEVRTAFGAAEQRCGVDQ